MKSAILTLLNNIYWFFRKLTAKGKKEYIFRRAFAGIQESKQKGNVTKWNIIESANKLLKPKRIITFHKGKSISKPKKSDHEVIETVKHQNADQLKEQHLRINNNGKFRKV